MAISTLLTLPGLKDGTNFTEDARGFWTAAWLFNLDRDGTFQPSLLKKGFKKYSTSWIDQEPSDGQTHL